MIGETLQPLASIRLPPTGVMWISIDPDTFEPVTIDSAGTIRRFRGNDGRAVLNGVVDPGAGVGANGDFYINTATWNIFGPKAAGTWPAGVSLIGGGGGGGVSLPSGLPNLVLATDPTGSTAHTVALRALVPDDIPTLPKAKVGLSDVDNTADALKPVSGPQAVADAAILASANSHADSGDVAIILSLGSAATKNVGTTAGTVAAGNDSRFSDARTPTAHASTHAVGGSDAIAITSPQISDASPNGRSILTAADFAAIRVLLSLVVGTDVQAQNANLAALAGLTGVADKLAYFTGAGAFSLADLTSFARTLLSSSGAPAARTTLGVSATPTGTGLRSISSDVEAATAMAFADVGRLFMSGCYFGALMGNVVTNNTTNGLFMTSVVVSGGTIASGIASGRNNGILFTVTATNGSYIGMASSSGASGTSVLGHLQLGTGRAYFLTRIRIGATLSTATDKYTVRAGFMSATTGAANGCWIDYTHDVNGGNWRAVASASGVSTGTATSTTNVTVTANTDYLLVVVVNAAGTSVEFFVNGTSIAVFTTNIPTASNTHVAAVSSLNRSAAGTTTSTVTQRELFWFLEQ